MKRPSHRVLIDPLLTLILISSALSLSQRRTYFTAAVLEILLRTYLERPGGGGGIRLLTPREREVVHLIAQGKSNKEVGRLLGVSVKTVESHRAAAMHKLGVSSVVDLVRYAFRSHMLEL